MVGVAFQADLRQENVGFFIPSAVINRFLRDVADGTYHGYPELGVDTATMENPALRAWAGMDDGETGVRVNLVHAGSSADGLLREGDVILAVDGRPVAIVGSVAHGDGRVTFGMLADRRKIGELLPLRILRDGTRQELDVVLKAFAPGDTRGNLYDRFPRYYVYGGLVFVPLDRVDMPEEQKQTALAGYGHDPSKPMTVLLKDDTVCIRCGLCALRCPTDAMTMERFNFTETTE